MKRIFIAVNLVLLSTAAYFGASLFYVIAAERFDTVPAQITKTHTIDAAQKAAYHPLSYYQATVKRNLFAVPKKKAAAKPVANSIETLKQTKLKLKLWGTVTSGGGGTYAVIEDLKKREQGLFQVGDTVQNARVSKVLREKIVLNVTGKDEILEIEDITPGRGRSRSLEGRIASAPVPQTRELEEDENEEVPEEHIALTQGRIDDAVKNLNELMKGARIRPHFTNGEPDGISLSRIRPDSIFTEIGLRNGDIIVGVDGEKIESVDDALTLYSSLKSGEDVNVQVKRNGNLQSIRYSIEE